MFNINKTPIIIISAPRTGSTALGSYLSRKFLNIKYFPEPDFTGNLDIVKFEKHFLSGNNFILKAHAFNLPKYNPSTIKIVCYTDLTYKIRIRRKDVAKQVVSLYIASSRGEKYHFKKAQYDLNDTIPIDKIKMIACIDFIIEKNKILENNNTQFDLDIFYEDIVIPDNDYHIVPKPTNYENLVEITRLLLENRNKVVSPPGYDPGSLIFQTNAMTTSAKAR